MLIAMKKQLKTLLIVLLAVTAYTVPALAQVAPDDIYVLVTDVDAPATVAPGETFDVIVYIEVNLPDDTYVEVGLYDPETYETMIATEDTLSGSEEGSYSFELTAQDVEGDFDLAADIFFEIEGELVYMDASELYFTITIQEAGGGLGIPGFPSLALILGIGLTAFMLQNTKKTPI